MGFFTKPEQFNAPHPPKGYINHLPELLFHALHHLGAKSFDRSNICEYVNGMSFDEDWLIIFQSEDGSVWAGTFRPGKDRLSAGLREEITKTYYFAKSYYGCYIIRKFDGRLISTPFGLDRLVGDPDFAESLFDLDKEELQWFDGKKPEFDYEVPHCNAQWFGFTHEFKGGFTDFSTWNRDGSNYRALFLKEKALFEISVRPYEENGKPQYDVEIIMNDVRPRCDWGTQVTGEIVRCTLGVLDKFSISYHEALGGDMMIQKNWENLKVTV